MPRCVIATTASFECSKRFGRGQTTARAQGHTRVFLRCCVHCIPREFGLRIRVRCVFARCELMVHGVAVSDFPVRYVARCTEGVCRGKGKVEGTTHVKLDEQGLRTWHIRRCHWNACSRECAIPLSRTPSALAPVRRTAEQSGPQCRGTTEMRGTMHCRGGAGHEGRKHTRIAMRMHHPIKFFNELCVCRDNRRNA
jgi:hypothetical protein